MRVIPFSTSFPGYHPKAKAPTYFVEKIWESVGLPEKEFSFNCPDEYQHFMRLGSDELFPKHNTIRGGKRWKIGDWFQPVIWGNDINPKSGRSGPYHSKQIKFAPPIQVVKTWDISIVRGDTYEQICISINKDTLYYTSSFGEKGLPELERLAKNDGLSSQDLLDWFLLNPEFKKTGVFDGQIICWNDKVNY